MEQAQAFAQKGDAALASGKAERASALYDDAIAAIGDRYRKPGALDDTSMKLILANAEAGKGKWDRAAHLKRGIVASRLAQANR